MRRAALRLAGFGAGYLVVVLLERLLDQVELQQRARAAAAAGWHLPDTGCIVHGEQSCSCPVVELRIVRGGAA